MTFMTNTDTTIEAPAEPRVYRIASYRMEELEAKFAKLAKTAAKLKFPAPTFTVVGEETEDETVWDTLTLEWRATGRVKVFKLVTVEGEAPKLNGWKLLGVIDHDSATGVVQVHTRDDFESPAEWRNRSLTCDHCGADRKRNKVIAVDNEDGKVMLVGSSCIKDFLGHNSPDAVANWCELIFDLDSAMDDDDWEDRSGGHYVPTYSPLHALAATVRAISVEGWVSAREAYNSPYPVTATKDIVANIVHPNPLPVWKDWVRENPITAADEAEAEAVVAWIKAQEPKSEYMANLKALAEATSISTKHFGMWVSAVATYRKDQEREIERALWKQQADAAKGSEFIAEPKTRLVVTGTVTMTREIPGDYGTRQMVKVLTEDGNVVVWWASGVQHVLDAEATITNGYSTTRELKQGDVITGKATVKEHDTYNKQTVVNRWAFKLVDEAADAIKLDEYGRVITAA